MVLKWFPVLIFIFLFGCNNKSNPEIIIHSEAGNIVLELYQDKAPVTVSNFIKYIEENRLKEAAFYRVVTLTNQPDSEVKIQVIQGGLYEDNHPDALPTIEHESTDITGILHTDGVISMARYGPGSATCEFFICVGDQPSLNFGGSRNGDGYGFAAFGRVIEGMDVVHTIHQSSADGQYLNPRIKILDVKVKK